VYPDVFDTVTGIPAHPLLVHAAVVFAPLLALFAVGYAVVPRLRNRLGWIVVALAVIAPASTLASKLSGEAFRRRLEGKQLTSPEMLTKLSAHESFGALAFWAVLALGVATLLMMIVVRSATLPQWSQIAASAVVVALALVAGYYIVRTGDSGAHVVWSGF
jgi:hypothetical protein